jgi:hypothetical protein
MLCDLAASGVRAVSANATTAAAVDPKAIFDIPILHLARQDMG